MTRVFATVLAALGLALAAAPAGAQAAKPEMTKVRLAVGGKPAIYYLPLTVTERLGYFKDEGLEVEISDLQGGSKALQSLIGGSADVVTGAFDHIIQMQAKNQPIVGVALLGRLSGIALGVLTSKAGSYKGPESLKGMKIGVTAPGSSTHFMVNYIMAKAGLKPEDASFIGVGTTSTAVAAVKRGEIDALANIDPVISLLTNQGLIKVVADTRTPEGSQQVYDGPYPAATLYVTPEFIRKNPNTTQALVNAFVRALKWMQTHAPEEIVKVLPAEYALGDVVLYTEAVKNDLPIFSPDGRFSREGAETAYKVLKAFDPAVAGAKIDLGATYTQDFVEKANAARK